MDDNVKKLDDSEEFLMESAEKRFERGDYFGALKILNRRAEKYDPSADACALYADIYEALGLFSLCADAWYRFLDTCNEADFPEGYEGLANAFMNMGDEFQANLYAHRIFGSGEGDGISLEELFQMREQGAHLRLVHSADGMDGDELLRDGIENLREGDLEGARAAFSEISPTSRNYASATGLNAMCMLLGGDVEGAAGECEKLIAHQPNNVQALTTYCAVLGAMGRHEEAREIGLRLAKIQTDSTEDLFRIATALCETGLDEDAYQKLTIVKERLPFSDEILFFHAVASYHTGRLEDAISSLETLTLINPRKAVARYYLERMRQNRDNPEDVISIGYFYRLPDEEYKFIREFFLKILSMENGEAEIYSHLMASFENFRLAFDQLDGRDEELQVLSARAAVKCRYDKFVREILLDGNVNSDIKVLVLHELVLRNEENSFGVVLCNYYREFFTHELNIGYKHREAYLNAFAEVYAKYYLLNEAFEEKIVNAAEDVYCTLEELDVTELAEAKNEMALVIFREARLHNVRRPIEELAELFEADVKTAKHILDYIM